MSFEFLPLNCSNYREEVPYGVIIHIAINGDCRTITLRRFASVWEGLRRQAEDREGLT